MVAPAVIAAGISAGSSILGGLFGKSSAKKAAKRAAREAELDRAMQREFAQNGIRWKVDDAKAAGLHPLAALGASTAQASPVAIGMPADNSMGSALSDMGQNIGRAVSAAKTAPERAQADALARLQLERAGLENELLRTQITSVNRALNPAMPRAGAVPFPDGDAVPSTPVSLKGTHLDNGPIVPIDSFSISEDPAGYLAAAGIVGYNNLKYFIKDIKSKLDNNRRNNPIYLNRRR